MKAKTVVSLYPMGIDNHESDSTNAWKHVMEFKLPSLASIDDTQLLDALSTFYSTLSAGLESYSFTYQISDDGFLMNRRSPPEADAAWISENMESLFANLRRPFSELRLPTLPPGEAVSRQYNQKLEKELILLRKELGKIVPITDIHKIPDIQEKIDDGVIESAFSELQEWFWNQWQSERAKSAVKAWHHRKIESAKWHHFKGVVVPRGTQLTIRCNKNDILICVDSKTGVSTITCTITNVGVTLQVTLTSLDRILPGEGLSPALQGLMFEQMRTGISISVQVGAPDDSLYCRPIDIRGASVRFGASNRKSENNPA